MNGSAQKNADLGACVLKAGHEVRNALFGISANLDTMRIDPQRVPMLDEYINRLHSETARISVLMADLLDLARPLSLEPRSVALTTLVERALGAVRARCRELDVEIRRTILPELEVWVDETSVESALRTLVDSALTRSKVGAVHSLDAVRLTNACALTLQLDPRVDLGIYERWGDDHERRRTDLRLINAKRHLLAAGGNITIEAPAGASARIVITLPTSPSPEEERNRA